MLRRPRFIPPSAAFCCLSPERRRPASSPVFFLTRSGGRDGHQERTEGKRGRCVLTIPPSSAWTTSAVVSAAARSVAAAAEADESPPPPRSLTSGLGGGEEEESCHFKWIFFLHGFCTRSPIPGTKKERCVPARNCGAGRSCNDENLAAMLSDNHVAEPDRFVCNTLSK